MDLDTKVIIRKQKKKRYFDKKKKKDIDFGNFPKKQIFLIFPKC